MKHVKKYGPYVLAGIAGFAVAAFTSAGSKVRSAVLGPKV